MERLRTYGHRPFEIAAHLDRFQNTLRLIQVQHAPSATTLTNLIHELLTRNSSLVESQGEVGITVWATPGDRSGEPPTLAIHLNRIDHAAVQTRRASGQAVVLTDVVQPDVRSWSRQAKVRSRLHYYLADSHAHEIARDSLGVLQDSDGSWTEASTANIALVHGAKLTWPRAARVLAGITQAHVRRVAEGMSIGSCEKPITLDLIRSADAMLLMGTDTGLWFASSIYGPGGEAVSEASGIDGESVVRRLQRKMHLSRYGGNHDPLSL